MIDGNLAYDYVGDIPWDKNPAFAFSNDAKEYISSFRNIVDYLPTKDLKISFYEDIWDFNPYFKSHNGKDLKIKFDNCSNEIKDYLKFYTLHCVMGKRKISTTNVRVTSIKAILNSIISNTVHKSIYVITTEDIINEISRRNNSPSTQHNHYEAIYQFYYFIINNYKLELPIELEKIKELGIKEKIETKRAIEETKLPNIPEEYFTAILSSATMVMRDINEDYNNRATACMIVMLSQLGLRIRDLLALTTEQLFSKKLMRSGNIAYYIHYKARKPSKAHSPLLEFDIFSNSLCTEAYMTLKRIRKRCEYSDKPFLYVLKHTLNSKDEFPVSSHRFNLEYKRFLHDYLGENTEKDWDGIRKSWFILSDEKRYRISVPDTRQYRVHLCTALYEKGIPLVYIQRYMSHLSEYMLGYYVRPKDTYQENITYSERVIKEIAENDTIPLGLYGEDIKNNIKKFIDDNNFNVHTDISEIVKTMGDKVIIRGKTGGVCIKTSLMPCSKDARTNEIMCAYNLCPNLFHFYYMADVTYINFQVMQDAYEENMKNGHLRAAEKERNKIRDLLSRRLIPELNELDKEIERKGVDFVINQYPSLKDIIDGATGIRKEIDAWMKD